MKRVLLLTIMVLTLSSSAQGITICNDKGECYVIDNGGLKIPLGWSERNIMNKTQEKRRIKDRDVFLRTIQKHTLKDVRDYTGVMMHRINNSTAYFITLTYNYDNHDKVMPFMVLSLDRAFFWFEFMDSFLDKK